MTRKWSLEESDTPTPESPATSALTTQAVSRSTVVVGEVVMPPVEGNGMHTPSPEIAPPVPALTRAPVAHHPEVQLLMERALRGDGVSADNLCTMVCLTIEVESATEAHTFAACNTAEPNLRRESLDLYALVSSDSDMSENRSLQSLPMSYNDLHRVGICPRSHRVSVFVAHAFDTSRWIRQHGDLAHARAAHYGILQSREGTSC